MLGRGAGPLQPPRLEPRVRDARRPPARGSASSAQIWLGSSQSKPVAGSPRRLATRRASSADDPPVGARLAGRRQGTAHALDPALRVREGPVLLGEGGGGQEDMRALRRLVHEEVLHHQAVELPEGLLGVVEIRLGQERVLAHHVHGADAAVEAALHHLGHDEAGRGRRAAAPGAREAVEARLRVVGIARQVGGDAAGVAAALHVVLAAQRRDARGGDAHLARGEREVQERMRIGGAVDVLGDPHAPDQAGAREGRAARTSARPGRCPRGGTPVTASAYARACRAGAPPPTPRIPRCARGSSRDWRAPRRAAPWPWH